MDKTRKFLGRVLDTGMECGVIAPDDFLRHVNTGMLALHLPKRLLATLITAGLKNKSFDASLVVEVLGVRSFAEHMPVTALWRIVNDAAAALLDGVEPVATQAKSTASRDKASKGKSAESHSKAPDKSAKTGAKAETPTKKSGKAKSKDSSKTKDSKSKDSGKAKDSKFKDSGKAKDGKFKSAGSNNRAGSVPGAQAVGVTSKVEVAPQAATDAPTKAVEEPAVDQSPDIIEVVDTAEPGPSPRPLPGVPEPGPVPQKKPNVSSRPQTRPGLVAKADAVAGTDEATSTTNAVEALSDFDVEVDTKVSSVPEPVGAPPPRAPTFDPEVENALDGLEMLSEEIILDDDFEIAEEEILDDSVHFDDATGRRK